MQLNTFLSLLSFSCLVIVAQTGSIEAASRIIGGSYASPGQFPYQVLVTSQPDGAFCGGSIISENYVVTAAHCLFRQDTNDQYQRVRVEQLSIRAGSISRSSGGTIVRISDAKIHNAYDPHNIADDSDIALLKLSEPLTFTDSIKRIELAKEAPPAGATITISGWGVTANSEPSEKLKYENMKAIPSNQRNLLALGHSEGHGSWSGDSGGPAVYENKLVGVCSFGSLNEEGNQVLSDVYILVPAFYEWLYSNSDLRN